MRFILCCIISLGFIYAAILRHDGYLVDPARLARTATAIPGQAGASVAAAAGPMLAARVEAFCRHDPAACLADAAALAGSLGLTQSELAQSKPAQNPRTAPVGFRSARARAK